MVRLPAGVPVGATIAVVVLPQTGGQEMGGQDEESRRERFAHTRAALHRAAERSAVRPELDDETLDALIDRARRS
jgi:hypothetical protein